MHHSSLERLRTRTLLPCDASLPSRSKAINMSTHFAGADGKGTKRPAEVRPLQTVSAGLSNTAYPTLSYSGAWVHATAVGKLSLSLLDYAPVSNIYLHYTGGQPPPLDKVSPKSYHVNTSHNVSNPTRYPQPLSPIGYLTSQDTTRCSHLG